MTNLHADRALGAFHGARGVGVLALGAQVAARLAAAQRKSACKQIREERNNWVSDFKNNWVSHGNAAACKRWEQGSNQHDETNGRKNQQLTQE